MTIDSKATVLQDRDIVLLRGLFESRVMTGSHAAALYFEGRDEAAKKRLQKLKAAGYIGERPRRAFEPSVLYLTRKGLLPLNERGILQEYPEFDLPALERRARVSPITLRHELEVMDVKAALHSALRGNTGLSLAEFTTWPLLNEFTACGSPHGEDTLIRPDGFVRIHENEPDGSLSEHAFFLEVDRSTESLDSLVFRAGCYLNYYKSGGFAERCGGMRSAFKDYPFRVLFVMNTAERRNNTAERLIQGMPPILTQVWLTTAREITGGPLGPIWIRPVDYRDLLKATPFESNLRQSRPIYQRQSAREHFVEKNIPKCTLIESTHVLAKKSDLVGRS